MFSKTFKNSFKCFVNNLKTFLKCWARALVHPRAPGGARERDPISSEWWGLWRILLCMV